ncbi:MAG: c-type cytochrome [Terrimicrobiaceae bacterium]
MTPARNVSLAIALLLLVGCDWMPGKPNPENRWQPADSIVDFTTLYAENCRGCHGREGTMAGSIGMDQPTYLSFIPEAKLRDVIANGVPGSNMPAFLQARGGMLTEQQIDALVTGILAAKPADPAEDMPPYEAALGDAVAGRDAFGLSCASCHGADGKGLPGKAGSVVAPAYLGMISDQYLRTITVAGRPELGCPDFRNRIPGRAMTSDEVSNITAWLASNRVNEFGQPIPTN